ncbi:hypothetical protein RND71_002006 [Anisodus tanguticus]|uniref:Uncharacterized protein n=1 Tax=Anisodus tanguticus TaxID=243964 RepID=A0AAE1T0B6_9SOLA|nr:hypothetical protein RND71_002006 [Anisodus tanguticus]
MSIALANDLVNLISLRIRVFSRIYIRGMNPNLGSTTTFNPHRNVPNTSRISTYKAFELRMGSKDENNATNITSSGALKHKAHTIPISYHIAGSHNKLEVFLKMKDKDLVARSNQHRNMQDLSNNPCGNHIKRRVLKMCVVKSTKGHSKAKSKGSEFQRDYSAPYLRNCRCDVLSAFVRFGLGAGVHTCDGEAAWTSPIVKPKPFDSKVIADVKDNTILELEHTAKEDAKDNTRLLMNELALPQCPLTTPISIRVRLSLLKALHIQIHQKSLIQSMEANDLSSSSSAKLAREMERADRSPASPWLAQQSLGVRHFYSRIFLCNGSSGSYTASSSSSNMVVAHHPSPSSSRQEKLRDIEPPIIDLMAERSEVLKLMVKASENFDFFEVINHAKLGNNINGTTHLELSRPREYYRIANNKILNTKIWKFQPTRADPTRTVIQIRKPEKSEEQQQKQIFRIGVYEAK